MLENFFYEMLNKITQIFFFFLFFMISYFYDDDDGADGDGNDAFPHFLTDRIFFN